MITQALIPAAGRGIRAFPKTQYLLEKHSLKKHLSGKKQLEEDLRRTYPVRAECDDYCLFQLKPHDVRD